MGNYSGVINNKTLLLGTLALSLGLCHQVTSYTLAKIDNPMEITISSSEDALIAIPNDIEISVKKYITIITTLTDKDATDMEKIEHTSDTNVETCIETNVSTYIESNNFYVTNNMSETINVNIYLDRSFIRVENQNATILPGETYNVPFRIFDSIEDESIEVIISATWSGGSAEIISEIDVDVESFIAKKVIDLRTPRVPVLNIDDMQELNIEDSFKSNEKGAEELQFINSENNDLEEEQKSNDAVTIIDTSSDINTLSEDFQEVKNKETLENQISSEEESIVESDNNVQEESAENEELTRQETGGVVFEEN